MNSIILLVIGLLLVVLNYICVTKNKISLKKSIYIIISIFLILEILVLLGNKISNYLHYISYEISGYKFYIMIFIGLVLYLELCHLIIVKKFCMNKLSKKCLIIFSLIYVILFSILVKLNYGYIYRYVRDNFTIKDNYVLHIYISANEGANYKDIYLYNDNTINYYENAIVGISFPYVNEKDTRKFKKGTLLNDFDYKEVINYVKNYTKKSELDESSYYTNDSHIFSFQDYECTIENVKINISGTDKYMNNFLNAIIY